MKESGLSIRKRRRMNSDEDDSWRRRKPRSKTLQEVRETKMRRTRIKLDAV